MNTFRLPFRWERIQPTPGGALDPIELGRIDAVVDHITSLGASVILDVHNYARFSTPASIDILGTNALPDTQLADLWTRLATQYANRAGVIFGVMNEPFGVSTEEVVGFTNLSLAAIRTTGANNLALVMGNGYSGAHSWEQDWYGTPNATAMLNIVDPGQNLAFEVHQYVDNPDGFALDYSGLTDGVESATIAPEKLSGFTDWLRLNNRRGFLGEFGTPSSDLGVQAMYNGVNFVEQNADVWMGWTLWSGGPWWDNPDGNPPTRYHLSLNPLANGDPAPQLAVLAPFFAPVPEPSSVLLLALGISGVLLLGRRLHPWHPVIPPK
jgi:endoglucanase